MDITSGQEVRETLAALAAAFVPGLTTVTAFDHMPNTFGGASPVSAIKMARRNREHITSGGSGGVFYPELHLLALYSDDAGNWTERDAENQIDAMEVGVVKLVDACQETDAWLSIGYAGDTTEDLMIIEGDTYRHMAIPLVVMTLP